MKSCAECGEPIPASKLPRAAHCSRRCYRRRQARKYYAAEPDKFRKLSRRNGIFHGVKRQAIRRGIAFELNSKDIEKRISTGHCEVTGIPFAHEAWSPWKPSIDRIEPSKGYTPDNVRVVIAILNMCKNQWSDNEVATFCQAFLNQRPA